MSGAREEVLARLRTALAAAPPPPPPAPSPAEWSRHAEGPPSPAACLDQSSLVELFTERVADYRADVVRCSPAGAPAAVAAALTGARRVVVPDGVPEQLLPHELDPVRDDGLTTTDLDAVDAVLTTAAVGIAETGTVVLDAGPGQGRRALTLLPDRHVCVVRADQVVPDVPDALARLDPARPLTWISGPSATSDIELDRVEGVHGPRRLHVIVVDAADRAVTDPEEAPA